MLKEKQKGEQKEKGALGSPSALCGDLVGEVQLAGGKIGPCSPTLAQLTSQLLVSSLFMFYYYITCLPHQCHTHTHTFSIIVRGQCSYLLTGFSILS